MGFLDKLKPKKKPAKKSAKKSKGAKNKKKGGLFGGGKNKQKDYIAQLRFQPVAEASLLDELNAALDDPNQPYIAQDDQNGLIYLLALTNDLIAKSPLKDNLGGLKTAADYSNSQGDIPGAIYNATFANDIKPQSRNREDEKVVFLPTVNTLATLRDIVDDDQLFDIVSLPSDISMDNLNDYYDQFKINAFVIDDNNNIIQANLEDFQSFVKINTSPDPNDAYDEPDADNTNDSQDAPQGDLDSEVETDSGASGADLDAGDREQMEDLPDLGDDDSTDSGDPDDLPSLDMDGDDPNSTPDISDDSDLNDLPSLDMDDDNSDVSDDSSADSSDDDLPSLDMDDDDSSNDLDLDDSNLNDLNSDLTDNLPSDDSDTSLDDDLSDDTGDTNESDEPDNTDDATDTDDADKSDDDDLSDLDDLGDLDTDDLDDDLSSPDEDDDTVNETTDESDESENDQTPDDSENNQASDDVDLDDLNSVDDDSDSDAVTPVANNTPESPVTNETPEAPAPVQPASQSEAPQAPAQPVTPVTSEPAVSASANMIPEQTVVPPVNNEPAPESTNVITIGGSQTPQMPQAPEESDDSKTIINVGDSTNLDPIDPNKSEEDKLSDSNKQALHDFISHYSDRIDTILKGIKTPEFRLTSKINFNQELVARQNAYNETLRNDTQRAREELRSKIMTKLYDLIRDFTDPTAFSKAYPQVDAELKRKFVNEEAIKQEMAQEVNEINARYAQERQDMIEDAINQAKEKFEKERVPERDHEINIVEERVRGDHDKQYQIAKDDVLKQQRQLAMPAIDDEVSNILDEASTKDIVKANREISTTANNYANDLIRHVDIARALQQAQPAQTTPSPNNDLQARLQSNELEHQQQLADSRARIADLEKQLENSQREVQASRETQQSMQSEMDRINSQSIRYRQEATAAKIQSANDRQRLLDQLNNLKQTGTHNTPAHTAVPETSASEITPVTHVNSEYQDRLNRDLDKSTGTSAPANPRPSTPHKSPDEPEFGA